jgi:hypothetical protein
MPGLDHAYIAYGVAFLIGITSALSLAHWPRSDTGLCFKPPGLALVSLPGLGLDAGFPAQCRLLINAGLRLDIRPGLGDPAPMPG